VSEFQEHSNEFTKLHYDIYGYIEINDDGKEVMTLFSMLSLNTMTNANTTDTKKNPIRNKKILVSHFSLSSLYYEVSIQNKLDGFVSEFQEHSNEFTKLHYDIFGYIEINDDGKEVKHTGELSRTKKVFEKYQEKYSELFNQIEGLLSGATTNGVQ
jgi:hypothetical protein